MKSNVQIIKDIVIYVVKIVLLFVSAVNLKFHHEQQR